MRIGAEQEVAAPPERVFARLADFGMFETRARRRNIPVERLEADPPAWRIGVEWRGVAATVDLRVTSVTPPEGYAATVQTRGVGGTVTVAVAPDEVGSRVTVAVDAGARGLAGRMLMQTLGFLRPALEGRLQGALSRLAEEIETGGTGAG